MCTLDIYFFCQITTFIKGHKIYGLKFLEPKNKGHTNFYECCDLTKKVYLMYLYKYMYIARCVVTCTLYHILQICSQSNALLWLLQHWGQKLSKSYTSSCCKSKFMSSNIFYFIFSSVRYMQLAVKQFPSTVIILSISLLFSSFNECNILYCTSTCLPI